MSFHLLYAVDILYFKVIALLERNENINDFGSFDDDSYDYDIYEKEDKDQESGQWAQHHRRKLVKHLHLTPDPGVEETVTPKLHESVTPFLSLSPSGTNPSLRPANV